VATAPPVRRWLLVEQPGPWGRDALTESTLDREIAVRLAARAAELGARLLLIRRSGPIRAIAVRRWAIVDSRPGRELVRWSTFADPAELPDLDPGAGTASTDPVYLVCTHGKHDTCCAVRGRPVAAALAASRPDQTWECSHVGGDRFAANVIMLPHGLYYGQVPAAAVGDLAMRSEAGRVDLRWLRGRSSLPAPAQAAQHFARQHLDEDRIDAVRPERVERIGHERWQVLLAGDPPILVIVEARHKRSDTPLTCSATVPAAIRQFTLIKLSTI
jgi:sucrase/ferredoxin-like protein